MRSFALFRDLFFFATRTEIAMVVVACIFFLCSGVMLSFIQLILGTSLSRTSGESLISSGEQVMIVLGSLGAAAFAFYFGGSTGALLSRHSMLARWKVEYLKAIIRQDIGWYDVNQAQALAGQFGESVRPT